MVTRGSGINGHMLVDRAHKIMYCFVPKSGCSTVLGLLAEASTVGNLTKHRTNVMVVHQPEYMRKAGITQLYRYKGQVLYHSISFFLFLSFLNRREGGGEFITKGLILMILYLFCCLFVCVHECVCVYCVSK